MNNDLTKFKYNNRGNKDFNQYLDTGFYSIGNYTGMKNGPDTLYDSIGYGELIVFNSKDYIVQLYPAYLCFRLKTHEFNQWIRLKLINE